MTNKTIPPAMGEKSFTCPHCGAIAAQTWYHSFIKGYEKDQQQWLPDPEALARLNKERKTPEDDKFIEFFERKASKVIFAEYEATGSVLYHELINLNMNKCYSCDEWSIWVADKLIYPDNPTTIEPKSDMPAEIRADFLEAAAIVDKSPRGS